MKAEDDKACSDILKRVATYGSRQGVDATLMWKLVTESIRKYNKYNSNKTKHTSAAKINPTQK